jgi:hypothetical protein
MPALTAPILKDALPNQPLAMAWSSVEGASPFDAAKPIANARSSAPPARPPRTGRLHCGPHDVSPEELPGIVAEVVI